MNLAKLTSETRNSQSLNLDQLSTIEMVRYFNNEDQKVPQAVEKVLPEVAKAVDFAYQALRQGGRIIYMGAGTSGRLGVLDAAECPPTFGVSPNWVVGLIAGGEKALLKAIEGAEDSLELGREDLQKLSLTAKDVVIGLAASGRTPYVIGGLTYANELNCPTVSISCNANSAIGQLAKVEIAVIVGPEALTGSTRMKSGTAQKLVLNMISTGAMVKMGKVYQNLMVDVKATNIKLVDRACRIVVEATGCDYSDAEHALKQTEFEVKPAILMVLKGCHADEAKRLLQQHQGYLRAALS